MLSTLKPSPTDPILALIQEFRDDPRPEKLDFGVGVYKDSSGLTLIPKAVKMAETRLLQEQDTKTYLGLLGDVAFNATMAQLVLDDAVSKERVSAIQTAGGSGALFLLLGLAKKANPDMTLWVSTPTWGNHTAIAGGLDIPVKRYRYFNPATRAVEFEQMREDLASAGPNDVIMLHGCCHNPTGANLEIADWQVLTDMALAQGFLPFVDIAYQGFGDGLDEDAAGLRAMAARAPEMLIATSCSKNFGLYRDRTGCAFAISRNGVEQGHTQSNMMTLMRISISMPPDHGAALVRIILNDAELRSVWDSELTAMRTRMLSLRAALADALRSRTNSDRFDFLARHRGMFSLVGATPEQAATLKNDHAVYIVSDGRMNVAGLKEDRIDDVAAAFAAVGL